jgi:hypothetical protein
MIDDQVIKRLLAEDPDFGEEQKRSEAGLSEAIVIHLKNNHRDQILKIQPGPQENQFLTKVAPEYFPGVSWLPVIYGSGIHEGLHWLLMEFIPNQWPRDRYNFDTEALAVLRQLHTVEHIQPEFGWEDHTWSEAQLVAAEKHLPAETMSQIVKIRERYLHCRERSSVLCSGDPNVPNWLIRDNDEIVLIDWQLVSKDHRALDIAGWIAYNLKFEEIEKIVETYRKEATVKQIHELAIEVFIFYCRRCTTNFWRAEISTKPELWAEGMAYSSKVLPEWLRTNGKACGLL